MVVLDPPGEDHVKRTTGEDHVCTCAPAHPRHLRKMSLRLLLSESTTLGDAIEQLTPLRKARWNEEWPPSAQR